MHEKSPAPLGFRRPSAPSPWADSAHRESEPEVAAGAAAKSSTVTLIGSRVPAACASLRLSGSKLATTAEPVARPVKVRVPSLAKTVEARSARSFAGRSGDTQYLCVGEGER